jgi:nickel/cobalt exporter
MDFTATGLYTATLSVAFFHTLNPDHWIPFVLVGRSQKWSILKTEIVALLAGIGHVGTSVIIALIGIYIGGELSERFATIAETVTGSALIIFGFSYAIYTWRQGGHAHFTIGGERVLGESGHGHSSDHNHSHEHDHTHEHDHSHEHDHTHDQEHSHDSTEEAHSHTHVETRSPYALVAIMGLTPCVALLPLAFASAGHGTEVTLGVIALFAVVTIGTILTFTYLGSKGFRAVRLEWFEKYGDIVTGIIIGCIGLFVVFAGL